MAKPAASPAVVGLTSVPSASGASASGSADGGVEKVGVNKVITDDAPFSKVVDMNDVFSDLKKARKTLNRGSFTSRAYDSALRRMLKAGASADEAKRFAKLQYRQASILFDA